MVRVVVNMSYDFDLVLGDSLIRIEDGLDLVLHRITKIQLLLFLGLSDVLTQLAIKLLLSQKWDKLILQ
jgi:hypothetical protein